MGTRSFIAQQTDRGIKGVYCHWDGYLSHNGRILQEHYSDPEKLTTLLAEGDISSLGAEIGSQHDFMNRPEGQCTFYHRDRGDDWKSACPQRFDTLDALLDCAGNSGCEYVYLFDGQAWQYAERRPQYFGMSDGTPFSAFTLVPESL